MDGVYDVFHGAHLFEIFGADFFPGDALEEDDEVHGIYRVKVQVCIDVGLESDSFRIYIKQLLEIAFELGEYFLFIHVRIKSSGGLLLGCHEVGECGHRGKMFSGILVLCTQDYAVAVFEGETELECVNGVEAESVIEERRICFDVRRCKTLKIQSLDDEFFYVVVERVHGKKKSFSQKWCF